MARSENPPFARGDTFYNGGTIDTANLGGADLEGQVWEFEDLDYSAKNLPERSGRRCKCMIVRNASGIALLPKRLVTFQHTAGNEPKRVDGYADLTAEGSCFPVDEFLGTAGVPNNDLFYIVIEGPAMCLTPLADMSSAIAVGDVLVSLTAATSQATSAGRVHEQDLTGATSVLGGQVQNRIGVALTARTTTETNANILIDIRKW